MSPGWLRLGLAHLVCQPRHQCTVPRAQQAEVPLPAGHLPPRSRPVVSQSVRHPASRSAVRRRGHDGCSGGGACACCNAAPGGNLRLMRDAHGLERSSCACRKSLRAASPPAQCLPLSNCICRRRSVMIHTELQVISIMGSRQPQSHVQSSLGTMLPLLCAGKPELEGIAGNAVLRYQRSVHHQQRWAPGSFSSVFLTLAVRPSCWPSSVAFGCPQALFKTDRGAGRTNPPANWPACELN